MLPELFWLLKAQFFLNFLCIAVVRILWLCFSSFESFSVTAAVFSISLSMYLSHADGVPITDQRTLKLGFPLLRVDTWKASHYIRKPFRAPPVCAVLRGHS